MTISPVSVGAAVTPTVIKTYISHYTSRASRREKPTAHISYDEGLHLIRSFLQYASHHTIEDLQAFTSQWVPTPTWVRTEDVLIPQEHITKAADAIVTQLGPQGIEEVGGVKWWQWRRKNVELKAEWVEMRADFNARKQLGEKSRRVMLYVHGGAYFFGSVDEHRYQLQRHARKLKARVFAPRYRLAPQFPFPCGLLDCLSTYLYLLTVHDKTEIIFAGDSAGGGMILSMLCLLRDQGLPLPAGAILISPWVDLTHSFPSVAEVNQFDYIPPYGFMQKPSISWPPPNDDEMDAIREGAGQNLLHKRNKVEKKEVEREASQGFAVHDVAVEDDPATNGANSGSHAPAGDTLSVPKAQRPRAMSDTPGPRRHLQIEINGKMVELKDQIQMYATNQLISHPMVSPALQPSLGGLPPLLVLVGGGEMLRDEQIYIAHKAAHPAKYPLGDEYRARYDPDDKILNKYKPTPVQLQVWEDLCHVAPTLSFTRPAKFMYRSVAQFGAWALARAQNSSIDIMDDDQISIISSDSDESRRKNNKANSSSESPVDAVGKAGDPLPPFRHHMIRQRVDRHGNISPMEDAKEFAALKMPPSAVGVIKVGPVQKWIGAKLEWDTKYAKIKRKVQKNRIADLIKTGSHAFEGENPPPSALAGRIKDESKMMSKPKKSYWLAIWSGWGSKHDEDAIQNEKDAYPEDSKMATNQSSESVTKDEKDDRRTSRARRKSDVKSRSRSRQRKRLTIVSDAGQVEGDQKLPPVPNIASSISATLAGPSQDETDVTRTVTGDSTLLTPVFLPKFKNAPHLRNESKDISDTSSIRTGHSVTMHDNASTRAVFSAAGVTKETSTALDGVNEPHMHDSPITGEHGSYRGSHRGSLAKTEDQRSTFGGYDSPTSRRSVERLMDGQTDMDNASFVGTDNSAGPSGLRPSPLAVHLRSPSTMAIVQHEGVVDEIEDNTASPNVKGKGVVLPTTNGESAPIGGTITVVEQGEVKHDRPALYDRSDLVFKTAVEHL